MKQCIKRKPVMYHRLCCRERKATEWLNQQQNILEQKQKDLTALLEQRKLLEMQIGKTQTELTTITDQINQNQQQTAKREIQI
ncbi:hypothetical protein M5E86_18935 [Blautia wexlerae]|nr:hypothetical protein M5E86_18935 [Blautia wexlerae]